MNKMKKNKLQIGIPCGKNSGEYIKFLLTTIRQTISQKTDYYPHSGEFRLTLGDNLRGVFRSDYVFSTEEKISQNRP